MQLAKLSRSLTPLAGLSALFALSACDMDVQWDGGDFDGVPLAELDLGGEPPSGLTLGGGDTLVITTGDTFAIEVEGSDAARERMRFERDGDTLSIARESRSWDDSDVATVNITMPPPSSLVIGGSGRVIAEDLAGDEVNIVIGGSGNVSVEEVDAGDLEIMIGGSGDITAGGTADRLDLTIGGNGNADMRRLQVGDADITIGGSGDASFASDGNVSATIGGSGRVRVRGSATCTVNAFGSGELICEEGEVAENEAG